MPAHLSNGLGMSIAADSLAAIKYAKVYPIYNKDAKNLEGHEYEYVEGADDDLVVGYRTEGDFPVYGNDDDRADDIAKWVVSTVMGQVKRLPVYRGAVPTQSILTITSNVEYGKNTGLPGVDENATRFDGIGKTCEGVFYLLIFEINQSIWYKIYS